MSTNEVWRQQPLFVPDSDWKMPTELPDLTDRKEIALDTEEYDAGLGANRGPGWPKKAAGGYICGVSWSTDGSEGYAPIRHPDSECFDKDQVSRWLKYHVKKGVRLVFQNAPYDVGWIWADLDVDIPPEYPIEDALCSDFMRDENEYEYNLDAICARLGIEGKDEALLREAGEAYLRPANAKKSWRLSRRELKANMYLLPARFVGPYATNDARQTLEAVRRLRPMLVEQNVVDAYRLEMDLVPTVRRMRARGIKIDEDRAFQIQDEFRAKRQAAIDEIKRRMPGTGLSSVDQLRQVKWLDQVFDMEGIRAPKTAPTRQHPDGQSSYKQDWMEKHPHWLPKLVTRALACDRFAETFMGEYVINFTHRGRIHAEAHQYKSDDGGTVSYRFAYSNPPLQQAPGDADPEFGVPFRSVFVAEGVWGANDYSQQEYRLTAHFAAACKVRGGEEAARQFRENPKLDFHKFVSELTGLPRPRAKIQNFALLYGQGLDATSAQLGISLDEAKEMRDIVASKAPFGPALDEYCKRRANAKGFLRLLDGARVRFDEWEAGWVPREEYKRGMLEQKPMTPCSLQEAQARRADPTHPWHGCTLRRAGVRKSLNRLIQGSAARQTKLAMRECARQGLIPILQMHDELDHDEDSPAKIDQVAEVMRTIVPLHVPMMVDTGYGKSWAAAKSKEGEKQPVAFKVVAGKDVTKKDAQHRHSRLAKRYNTEA